MKFRVPPISATLIRWIFLFLFIIINSFLISIDLSLGFKFFLLFFSIAFLYLAFLVPEFNSEVLFKIGVNLLGGFYICAISWPKYGFFKYAGLPSLSPSKLMYALILLFWIFSIINSQKIRDNFYLNLSQVRLFFCLIVLMVFSTSISYFTYDKIDLFVAIKLTVEEFFGFYFSIVFLISFLRNTNDVIRITNFIIISFVIVICWASIEKLIGHTIFSTFITADDDITGRLSEVLNPKIRDGLHRLQSSFEHPLVFGKFLLLIVPLLLFKLFSTSKHIFLIIKKISLCILLIVTLYFIYQTGSRSALALCLSSIAITFVLLPLFKKNISIDLLLVCRVVFSILLFCFVSFFLKDLLLDIISAKSADTVNSSNARMYMLITGIPLIFDHPWFGWGLGESPYLAGVIVTGGIYSIDNFFLSTALDFGLLVLILFISIMFICLYESFSCFFDRKVDENMRFFGLMLAIAALLYFLNLSILSISSNNYLFFSFICMFLLLRFFSKREYDEKRDN